MVRSVAILFAAALLATVALGNEPELEVSRIVASGCKVVEVPPYWKAVVWADYDKNKDGDHDYRKVLAVRPKRRKALLDCDDWLTDIEKQQAQMKKNSRGKQKEK